MFVINFLLDCARRARGARTEQSSKKIMTNLLENGYIHEFGFSRPMELHICESISPIVDLPT
jgi:hypothetical protein